MIHMGIEGKQIFPFINPETTSADSDDGQTEANGQGWDGWPINRSFLFGLRIGSMTRPQSREAGRSVLKTQGGFPTVFLSVETGREE